MPKRAPLRLYCNVFYCAVGVESFCEHPNAQEDVHDYTTNPQLQQICVNSALHYLKCYCRYIWFCKKLRFMTKENHSI